MYIDIYIDPYYYIYKIRDLAMFFPQKDGTAFHKAMQRRGASRPSQPSGVAKNGGDGTGRLGETSDF